MSKSPLPLPEFFDPHHCFDPEYYSTFAFGDVMDLVPTWCLEHNIQPSINDEAAIIYMRIDCQNDFVFPPPYGSLFVGGRSGDGAMQDQLRSVEFGYRNLGIITEILHTQDTHQPYQIFFGIAHLDENNQHPEPFTTITADEYKAGKYRPNPEMADFLGVDISWLTKQFTHYCEQLEKAGRFTLTIWPRHTLFGSWGHRITSVEYEMKLFHESIRGLGNYPVFKGINPLTEHYSVFEPEILTTWEGGIIQHAWKNTVLLDKLLGRRGLYQGKKVLTIWGGQAKSHCVAWSLESFLREIMSYDPSLAQNVYILEDCSSPVCVPDPTIPGAFLADYTKQAQDALDSFSNLGAHVVRSTEPIGSWPGIISKYV